MKWRLFACGALAGGYAALRLGAPLAAILAGIAVTALLTFWQQRKKSQGA